MFNFKRTAVCLGALVCAMFVAGCASTVDGKRAAADDADDKEYLTGSRIPRKSTADSISKMNKDAAGEFMRDRPQGLVSQ